MKPNSLSWADMPMSTANHNNVSHAPFSFKHSAQEMTPETSWRLIPNIAATTGAMPNGWKTHMNTVMLIVITTMSSSCVSGPSSFNLAAACAGASGVDCTSGGYNLYTKSGVTSKPMMAGTHAALNQVNHGETTTMPRDAASLSDNKFCAAAVMHIALECPLDCNCDCTKNAPSFFDVGPGSEPACLARLVMIGKYTPPARAVVLGIAGAKSASESVNPYDNPSVDFPSARTNNVATRSPKPVRTNPLAKKNASTMSQITSFVIALNAA
mmetsp:Transcript_5719/g.20713  ORF Transcript_5719/g.20713 Transcript_5719/m.20713 type:complete len:269 (+) Transcript_5719:471-1277(+)